MIQEGFGREDSDSDSPQEESEKTDAGTTVEDRIRKMTQEELISRAYEILGSHADSSSGGPERDLSKEERAIVIHALSSLDSGIQEPVYIAFPEIAMRALAEMALKKSKEATNKVVAEAYHLLHDRARTKGEIVFNEHDWKAIEDAWPDLDPEVQKCALLILPALSMHVILSITHKQKDNSAS